MGIEVWLVWSREPYEEASLVGIYKHKKLAELRLEHLIKKHGGLKRSGTAIDDTEIFVTSDYVHG